MQITSRLQRAAHQLSEAALGELISLFGPAMDPALPVHTPAASKMRDRIFTPRVTFWAHLSQILTRGSSCRQAVLKVQALRLSLKQPPMSASTSAYCQARARLSGDLLKSIGTHIVERLEAKIQPRDLWMERHVKIVDSTSTSLPDTARNQKQWPQPSGQKMGCGFPVMKICGLFSLATGALISSVQSHLHVHDGRLFAKLWRWLSPGDVILADRAFCSFMTIALLSKRNVDCVFRLHQARSSDFRKGKRLGENDRLIRWKKPLQRTATMTKKTFRSLPPEIVLRQLKFFISVPGFRTKTILLITTLIDHKIYSASSLSELFRKRWNIELFFRDIKTTMGMEVLRSQSPSMALKELSVFLIAYNLIRFTMFEAAKKGSLSVQSISFKGTVDLLTACTWLFHQRHSTKRLRRTLLLLIASDPLLHRPDRSEPRAQKRRPKPYQYLSAPRHLMVVTPHRDKYKKKPLT